MWQFLLLSCSLKLNKDLYVSNISEFNLYTNDFQLSTTDGVYPLLEGIGWVALLRLAPESLNPVGTVQFW